MKHDWIIHLVSNGEPCSECGEVHEAYLSGFCDAHTHGLDKYGHLEFQVVVALPHDVTGGILNNLGNRVKDGEKFEAGAYVNNIIMNFPVRLDEQIGSSGEKLLRVILPDPNGKFPGDTDCQPNWGMQALPLSMLENIRHEN